MTLHKTLLALSIAIGVMLVGGCSSKQPDSATNVPGPPSGPQPAAANIGAADSNSVDINTVGR